MKEDEDEERWEKYPIVRTFSKPNLQQSSSKPPKIILRSDTTSCGDIVLDKLVNPS